MVASLVAEHGVLGARTQLLRRTWSLPRPAIEPVSPVCASREVRKSFFCILMRRLTGGGKIASGQSPEKPPRKGQGLETGFNHQRPMIINSIMSVL